MSFKLCKDGGPSLFTGKLSYKKNLARLSTFIFITIPYALFAGTGMIWYIRNNGWGVPVFITCLFVSSLSFFLISSFSDPGVIPRQFSTNKMYDLYSGYKKTCEYPSDINMMINGKFLLIKYCNTCHIYRSPRSIHCRICDVCVQRFDHHCKWLGNCVGYYNYRSFIAFIFSTFLSIIAEIVLSVIRVAHIASEPRIFRCVLETTVLLVYIVFSGWFIAGLFFYHCFLMFTNQTTNEQLKGLYSGFNPWNRGIFSNLKEVLFTRKFKGPFYSRGKGRVLYNPVSQFSEKRYLSLLDKFVFSGSHDPQSSLPSSLTELTNEDPFDCKVFKVKDNPRFTPMGSANDILSQLDLKDSFVIESQKSSDLSIETLMSTYSRLKNNLNETSNLNQLVLKALTKDSLVDGSSQSSPNSDDYDCR